MKDLVMYCMCTSVVAETGKIKDLLFEPRCEKLVFGISDQVRHEPGCTATEDS